MFRKFCNYGLALLLLCNLHLANAKTFYGATNLTHATLDSVEINGGAMLHDVHFNSLVVNGVANVTDFKIDTAKIHGSFNVRNGQIQDGLEVHGSFIGHRINITGNTIIFGNMKLHNSTIQSLELSASSCLLKNTIVKNIIFKTTPHKKKQKLFLQGKTIVNGNITFTSGNGMVYATKKVIIKGKIIGGMVVRKN